jgi:hypothetical protein
VGTGQDIVAILAEGNLKYNTIYLSIGMMLLGLSIWMLPSIPLNFYAFYTKHVLGNKKNKRGLLTKINLFKSIYKDYNGDKTNNYINYAPTLSSKTLALLPWVLLNVQILNFYVSEDLNLSCPIASIITVLFLLSLYVFNKLVEKTIKSKLFHKKYIAIFILLSPLISIYFLFKQINPSGFGSLVIYMLSNYLIFNFIIVYLDLKLELFDHSKKLKSIEILKKINYLLLINILVIASTFIFLTILSFKTFALNANIMSGVVLLVFGIIPYILFVDNVYFALKYTSDYWMLNFKKYAKKWRMMNIAIVTIFLIGCWLLFIKNNNKFNKPNIEQRQQFAEIQNEKYKLTNRFDKFYQSISKNGNAPVNVFLISGQGGGSRAAACFLNIMLNADIMNKEWYKNIFSISTISGSSAGAMQYFYLHQLPDNVMEQLLRDNKSKANDLSAEIVKSCYSYNYMNSNFLGLLYYDRLPVFLKNIVSKSKWVNRSFDINNELAKQRNNDSSLYFGTFNRNYIQEEEERKVLLSFIANKTSHLTGQDKTKMDSFYRKIASNYFCYKNLINDSSTQNPLFIMNTTMLSRGRKGYFTNANINVNPNWTNLAFTNPYFSMHSASIASQSVPILNTFYETYETALCDGGFYENSGTSTTYDIYKQLRAYSTIKKYNVRFVLVNIFNQTETIETESYWNSAFITTVNGLFAQIFNGHEKDAIENIKRSTQYFNSNDNTVKDTVINFNLNYSVATTRSLRKNTLDTILKRSIDSSALRFLASVIQTNEIDLYEKSELQEKYIIYPQCVVGYKFKFEQQLNECFKNKLVIKEVENMNDIIENDIRFYHAVDGDMALQIKQCLEKDGKTIFKIKDLSHTTYKNMVKPHTIEIWHK